MYLEVNTYTEISINCTLFSCLYNKICVSMFNKY